MLGCFTHVTSAPISPAARLDDGIAESRIVNSRLRIASIPRPFISEYEVTAPETLRRDSRCVTPHNDCVHQRGTSQWGHQRHKGNAAMGCSHSHPIQRVSSRKKQRGAHYRGSPTGSRRWRRERVTHTWLTAACATALRTLTATMRSIARTARSKGSRARFSYGNTR